MRDGTKVSSSDQPPKYTTAWKGGFAFLGRYRWALRRSWPYAASKLTFS